MRRFHKGDWIRYRSDGKKGRCVEVQEHCVTLMLTDGSKAYLHPDDAAETLERWVGDPREGGWSAIS